MWNDLELGLRSWFVLIMADDAERLMPADLLEVTWCNQYALGWDSSGKPRGVKLTANDHPTAQWLDEHLTRSRFVVMRRRRCVPMARRRAPDPEALVEAELADLADALYSALCFDETGKQRSWWERVDALASAEWLAHSLRDRRFVVLRRSSAAKRRTG